MKVQAEPSSYRIEKARADAVITLAHGDSVRGCFFVAHASARLSGPELVGELLNSEAGFFPFEVHGPAGVETVLFNRRHVITVVLADNEAQRDPGYDVAPERFVSILLTNGERIRGSVRIHRPAGRDRVSDWARQPEHFRYLETETMTMLVNVGHVIEVKETDPRV